MNYLAELDLIISRAQQAKTMINDAARCNRSLVIAAGLMDGITTASLAIGTDLDIRIEAILSGR